MHKVQRRKLRVIGNGEYSEIQEEFSIKRVEHEKDKKIVFCWEERVNHYKGYSIREIIEAWIYKEINGVKGYYLEVEEWEEPENRENSNKHKQLYLLASFITSFGFEYINNGVKM